MRLRIAIVLLVLASTTLLAQPITLNVDATEVNKKILHSRLTIPAQPGRLTLVYPKWIPGEHGPSGPITDLVGISITAAGRPILWQRDALDVFLFHTDVPSGANSVEVALDFITPSAGGNFTAGPSLTNELGVISWNTLLLYPRGAQADALQFMVNLQFPSAWKYASALPVASDSSGRVQFRPVSLATLVDSPLLMGRHTRFVTIGGDPSIPHEIDIAADSSGALELPPNFAESYGRLVAETEAMFGGRPYRRYRWLLALSDSIAHFGLEHHESSDNRMPEATLLKEPTRRGLAGLLAHEFVHTWNGKYRRPADMIRADYEQPLQTELLWVYEGLTTYLGAILPARTGLWTPEYFREVLARVAAELDTRPGRSWRALSDTAVSAQFLFGSSQAWRSLRRGVDFYDESILIWLEADLIIRQRTTGRRSLDDFLRAFYGGQNGAPAVKPYTFDEIVSTLNAVAEYDWATFFRTRVREPNPRAPLGGIENAGWRLVFNDVKNESMEDAATRSRSNDWQHSLGFLVAEDGRLVDVIPGSPAAQAGVAPGMKLVAVNKRRWTPDMVSMALRESKTSGSVELLVESADFYTTHLVKYTGGDRYPHLERIPAKPDLLQQVINPLSRN